MNLTFRTYDVLEESDISVGWHFVNPDLPNEKLEGNDGDGYHPATDSSWNETSPLVATAHISLNHEIAQDFASLLRERQIFATDARFMLELSSSLSTRASENMIIPKHRDSCSLTLALEHHTVPANARFRLLVVADGRIRIEKESPLLMFAGMGTELAIHFHTDLGRPPWDWEIDIDDPYADLLSENLRIFVLKDKNMSLEPVSVSGGEPSFGQVPKMLWADIISHVLIMTARTSSGSLNDIQSIQPPENMVPGCFINAARNWYRFLAPDNLESLLENPPALRRAIINKILQKGT